MSGFPTRQSDLKIAHKVAILVAIPSICFLIFFGILVHLLNEAEADAQREARQKDIEFQTNKVTTAVTTCVSSLTTYAVTQQKDHLDTFHAGEKAIQTAYEKLRILNADEPQQLKKLSEMRVIQNRLFKLMNSAASTVAQRDSEDDSFISTGLFSLVPVREQMESLTGLLLKKLKEFHSASQRSGGETAELSKQRLKQFINLGMLFTIVISASLAALFARGITRRLSIVVDNTGRLAKGETLEQTVEGKDEIAQLDGVFHQMAYDLEAARKREMSVVNNAVDVICALDESNRFSRVSPASLTVWGYAPEELFGKSITDIIVSDDRAAAICAQTWVKQEGSRFDYETRVATKDARIVDMLWSSQWNETEQMFFCVAHDITTRKQAEDQLRDSEARVRLMIESMPVGLIIIDENGYIEKTNIKSEQMFGHRNEKMLKEHLSMLFDEKEGKDPQQFIQSLKEKFIGKVGELQARKSNGESFPVEISLNQFQSENERKLLTIVIDATERHEIERMKQEFVAMVSHDLKSPLTSIQGTFAMLHTGRYGTLNEQGMNSVVRAEAEIDRLVDLINSLLDMEKMQAGKLQMDKEVVSIDSVVSRAIDAVAQLAEKSAIKIEFNRNSLEALADGPKLVQVIVNLLSNAIKFSPRESTIKIECEEITDWLEIRVIDQGRGIPESHKERIFERFEQVRSSDRTTKGGTGLGLAICKAIIEGHQGQIAVESNPEEGATFWFRIPQPD